MLELNEIFVWIFIWIEMSFIRNMAMTQEVAVWKKIWKNASAHKKMK